MIRSRWYQKSNGRFHPLCLSTNEENEAKSLKAEEKVLKLLVKEAARRKKSNFYKMRLLMWNSAVESHKSFLILIIAVLVGSCRGSSIDGVSLRFNKRGEREKIVNEFSIRTSAHEMWTYIKSHLTANRRKKRRKKLWKPRRCFGFMGIN